MLILSAITRQSLPVLLIEPCLPVPSTWLAGHAAPGATSCSRWSATTVTTIMSQNRRDTRAASKSRSGEETEHDDNPNQTNFEDFVRNTLTSLGSKIDQLLTGQRVLEEKVSGLETRVNTNTLTIGNITESLELNLRILKIWPLKFMN